MFVLEEDTDLNKKNVHKSKKNEDNQSDATEDDLQVLFEDKMKKKKIN